MKFFFTGPVCPAGTALSFRHRHRYRPLMFLMKVSCVYIVLMVLSLQVLLANKGRGQNLDQINVTIGMQNQSIETLFNEIKLQTGLTFAFSSKDMQGVPTVSLALATRSVKSTLDLALVGTALRYEQVDQNVIVSRGAGDGVGGAHAAFSIRGKVTNSQGEPMPGVSVYVKETTRGTTSDAEGIYVITAEANDVLVFSFVGFKTQEVNVDARGVIDVGMEDDLATLGEVVVNAGYWSVNKKLQTGNIGQVTSAEIAMQPISNPLQALQGRVSGVYIEQLTGVPGGGFNIKIRGQNSLRSSGNDPLYIIDGVPFTATSLSSISAGNEILPNASPLNNINPYDIESIEILKDADATAIYGSRGANGVVLITTKKARPGKTKVDMNFYTGVGEVAKKMKLLNTEQYLEMRREAYHNDDITPSGWYANDLLVWDSTRHTDWQKELIGGSAKLTNAQVSVSAGSQNTQFSLGGGYYSEGTVFPGSFADRKISSRFNLNHLSDNEKFRLTITTNYLANQNNLPRADVTQLALTLAPNAPSIYNDSGNLNWENSTWTNPFQELVRNYDEKTNNLIAHSTLQYKMAPGLFLSTALGYTNIETQQTTTLPIRAVNPAYPSRYQIGSAYFAQQQITTTILEPKLDYEKKLRNSKITVLVGASLQKNIQHGQTLYANGFTSDALIKNIQSAPSITVDASNFSEYKYAALFSRINYDISGKYLFNLTARRDGSSRFGPDKRFANFGAIGAAWIFSNENFFQQSSLMSFGKLRTSYGTTGSDRIDDYGYMETYTSTSYPYQLLSGIVPTRLSNPDYSWERNKKFEIGLEVGFFDDKIFLMGSYYSNRSSNQLVGYALPPTTGFTTIQYNLPANVENSGIEIELNTIVTSTNGISWTSGINFTIPQNKLISYPNIKNSSYDEIYEVGKSLFTQKKFHYEGVDPQSGLYTYQDVDNNESWKDYPADLQAIKKIAQSYYGGFKNNLSYKGFNLDILIQFVKQTGWDHLTQFPLPGTSSNQPSQVLARWQQLGDNSEIQKFTQDTSSDAGQAFTYSQSYGDKGITDTSFIRFKNISLSWQIPLSWNQRLKIRSGSVFLRGQNIFTITNYKGLDPEQSTQTMRLPILRVFTAGVNITL